jgi:hypothetical protein
VIKKCLLISVLFFSKAFAQQDSLSFFEPSKTFNQKRFYTSTGAVAVGATTSLILLNELWYKDYPRAPLHLFNDNHEWLQMDKIGHATTAYSVGYVGDRVLRWSGVERKKAIWYGGSLGLAYLTAIEFMDGFSAEWGFSLGDMLANIAGSAMYISQELMWSDQRIRLKFSAHLSPYAQYRPNVLGSTVSERLLKDYNGQTYWLSANVSSFLPETSRFPQWLNVAFGYSGEEMIKGDERHYVVFKDGEFRNFNAYRQYFLSLDIDLTKIKTKNHFLKTVLGTFNYLKIPFPALEFSNRGVKGHGVYY